MQDNIKKQNDIVAFAKSLIKRTSNIEGEIEIVKVDSNGESYSVEFSNHLENGVYIWMYIGITPIP